MTPARIRGPIMRNLPTIWHEVSGWPAEQRRELAVRLLESLEQQEKLGPISPERQQALRRLIGIWKTSPPPTDEEVQQILEQERMKKYG